MAEKIREKGGSLAPIYDRLSTAGNYHPYSAETFSDWSLESGDVITLYKEGTAYQSPVYTSRMVWRGAPETTLTTTGNQEREAVAKLGNRKYGGGGGGYRNTDLLDTRFTQNQEMILMEAWDRQDQYQQFYSNFQVTAKKISAVVTKANENGEMLKQAGFELTADGFLVYAVDATKPLYITSMLNVMADGIRAEVNAADSQIYSYIDLTASSLRTEIGNSLSGVYSTITQTAEEIKSEVYSSESNIYSFISQTASSIRSEVGNSLSGVYSTITQTAESIMSAVNSADSNIYSFILQTASGIQTEVGNALSGVYSSIKQTADEIRTEVYASNSDIYSYISQTASGIRSEVGNSLSGMYSVITQTAEEIRSDVYAADSAIYSFISQTASGIRTEVGNTISGVYSSISQTAEEIRTDVYAADSAIYTYVSQTASGIKTEVGNTISGVYTSISQTADTIRSEVNSADSAIYSYVQQTTSGIVSEVGNSLSGVYSSITQNADKIALVVNDDNTLKQASIIAAINGTGGSSVTISADKVNLAGYVTARELQATNANISNLESKLSAAGTATIGNLTSTNAYLTSLTVNGIAASWHSMNLVGTVASFLGNMDANLQHSHRVSMAENVSDGTVTITIHEAQSTKGTANFSIAATTTYKNGVAAAASNVHLKKGAWSSTGQLSVTKTSDSGYPDSVSVQLTLSGNWGTGEDANKYTYTVYDDRTSTGLTGTITAPSSGGYTIPEVILLFENNVDFASATAVTATSTRGSYTGTTMVNATINGDAYYVSSSKATINATIPYDDGWAAAQSMVSLTSTRILGPSTKVGEQTTLYTLSGQTITLSDQETYNKGWQDAANTLNVTTSAVYGPSTTVGSTRKVADISGSTITVSDQAAYNRGYEVGYDEGASSGRETVWAEAYGKVKWPSASQANTFSVSAPSSTVGGTSTHTFGYSFQPWQSSGYRYIDIVDQSNGNRIVARTSVNIPSGYTKGTFTEYSGSTLYINPDGQAFVRYSGTLYTKS